MQKKILVRGPLLSRSGYGEQARFALRALRSRPDLFDIYLLNTPWGATGQIAGETEERNWINEHLIKTAHYQQAMPGAYDLSLQITIPNEFEALAPINIGYTAGIETNKAAPQWLVACNEKVQKVITISEHSKRVLEQTTYDVKTEDGAEIKGWGMQVPVEFVDYPVRTHEPEPLDIELSTSKNFLAVSQWSPRKNFENMIKWFVEEYRDDEEAGLVIKTNCANDSLLDRMQTQHRLGVLLHPLGERKCKVHLIHGELTAGQLTWLYTHPTMKAMINIAHGEGFGIPMLEAASLGLPLVTVTWSGQMDFICKQNKKGKRVPHVARVDYDIAPVQPEDVWEGVITAESMWAWAREGSYKKAIREILTKEKHYKTKAEQLQKHVLATFTKEAYDEAFVKCITDCLPELTSDQEDVDSWLEQLDISTHE